MIASFVLVLVLVLVLEKGLKIEDEDEDEDEDDSGKGIFKTRSKLRGGRAGFHSAYRSLPPPTATYRHLP